MIQLPTKKERKKFDLENISILLYGPPKIGKTTFASQFPNAIFIATEPGHKYVEVSKIDADKWQTILDATEALKKQKHDFKTIVIDTVDNAFALCRKYVFEKNKITHEQDFGFGKGHDLVQTEWRNWVLEIGAFGLGVVYISHVIEKKDEKTGMTKSITPSLKAAACTEIASQVDCIMFCKTKREGGKTGRVIYTQPQGNMVAGDRTGVFTNHPTFDLSYEAMESIMSPYSITPEEKQKSDSIERINLMTEWIQVAKCNEQTIRTKMKSINRDVDEMSNSEIRSMIEKIKIKHSKNA